MKGYTLIEVVFGTMLATAFTSLAFYLIYLTTGIYLDSERSEEVTALTQEVQSFIANNDKCYNFLKLDRGPKINKDLSSLPPTHHQEVKLFDTSGPYINSVNNRYSKINFIKAELENFVKIKEQDQSIIYLVDLALELKSKASNKAYHKKIKAASFSLVANKTNQVITACGNEPKSFPVEEIQLGGAGTPKKCASKSINLPLHGPNWHFTKTAECQLLFPTLGSKQMVVSFSCKSSVKPGLFANIWSFDSGHCAVPTITDKIGDYGIITADITCCERYSP